MRLWPLPAVSLSRTSLVNPTLRAFRRNAFSSQATPPLPNVNADPALVKIVDDISKLSLLQVAELVSLLKIRLNIQEIVMPVAPTPTAAPVAPVDEAPAEEVKPKEKTIFSVKIESIDPAAKPKIIREVKAQVANLNLMEAKRFVESLPKVVKENLPKEDAEKLKAIFEGLGAKVSLE